MRKILSLSFLIIFLGCSGSDTNLKLQTTEKKVVKDTTAFNHNYALESEEGIDDPHISSETFKRWKGTYLVSQEALDGWGRDSKIVVNINLIRPDSSIFEFWLADSNGVKYETNNNFLKMSGGLYGNNDSISFFEKEIIEGKNNNVISPSLIIYNDDGDFADFSIKSQYITPAHNSLI
ncbi:MAG TPA: hypothetical protein VF691_04805, partial [Cytophagaceae bacterium]